MPDRPYDWAQEDSPNPDDWRSCLMLIIAGIAVAVALALVYTLR